MGTDSSAFSPRILNSRNATCRIMHLSHDCSRIGNAVFPGKEQEKNRDENQSYPVTPVDATAASPAASTVAFTIASNPMHEFSIR